MRDVWISPALPADRSSLAAALPPDLTLSDATIPPPDAIVVVSGYETDRIRSLSFRDPGTALVVVCAPDAPAQAQVEGRQPEVLTTATTVAEVAQAVRQASTASTELPWWVSPAGEQPTATTWLAAPAEAAAEPDQQGLWQRHRAALLSATAVVLALLIGIVVVVANKDDSSASAAANPAFGGSNPTQQLPNTGTNPFGSDGTTTPSPSTGTGDTGTGGTGTGGTGTTPQDGTGTTPQDGTTPSPQSGTGTTPQDGAGTAPQDGSGSQGFGRFFGPGGGGGLSGIGQDFLTCLRNNGVDVGSGSLRQLDLGDPTVRSAFQTCAQEAIGGGSNSLPGGSVPTAPASPSGSTKTTT